MPDPSRRGASASLTAAAAAGTPSESPERRYNTEATTIRDRVPSFLEILVPANDSNNHPSEAGRFSPSVLELDRCDSPRSNVAARFEALDIYHDAGDAPRKRARTTIDSMRGEIAARFEATPEQNARLPSNIGYKGPGALVEIAETPGCRHEATRSSPTSSPLARQTESLTPTTHDSPIVKTSPKRMRSPPPPLPTSDSSPPSPKQPGSIKPLPTKQHQAISTSPEVHGLTWQDSEITGHEIHRSLGDDGEGINGIGFRPTPAIAQARSQKRKHQLSEWRAREAREARQRRFEKRQQGGGKGCSVDVGDDGDDGQRRVVRFEEIG